MIPLEVLTTIGGMIIPPVFDLIKRKIAPNTSTPEETISTIAITGQGTERIPEIVEAYSKLYQAKKEYFNRDVIGQPSQWVIDLRASIRPITVALALGIYILAVVGGFELPDSFTVPASGWIGLWFGDRMRLK